MAQNISLPDFLKNHSAEKGGPWTNGRIGDQKLGIYPGSYLIPAASRADFLKKYYRQVFILKKEEYLTEKPLIENGPILIDLDFRYAPTIKTRQHTEDHIIDGIVRYMEKISDLVLITPDQAIDVFVMEKKEVNLTDPGKTKDGIHILIGLKMHKALQVLLRTNMLDELKSMWDDLPITNTWDDVLDEGVSKGHSPWQMYGSNKPAHQAYLVTYHFNLLYSSAEQGWTIEEKKIAPDFAEKYLEKLSSQYTDHLSFPMKETVRREFEINVENLHKKNEKPSKSTTASGANKGKHPLKIIGSAAAAGCGGSRLHHEISSETILDELLAELFADMGKYNYQLKETHQYTMSLPPKYYGPGSYLKWLRVGWALANTSSNMWLTWLKFSCQEGGRDSLKDRDGKFDWTKVSELYEIWRSFDLDNPDGLTYRSIMYWSRNDAKEKFKEIHCEAVDFFAELAIKTTSEFDFAQVLLSLYKGDFVCASIKNNVWYKYNNHRWSEIDSGYILRLLISKDLHNIFQNKLNELINDDQLESEPDKNGEKSRADKLANICIFLKKTTWKNNIMRECRELFYDEDFVEKLDQNPYLLCFNNYVVDFKHKVHRKGQPDDYISKCTNIDYIPFETVKLKQGPIIADVEQFIKMLFPNDSLREYMWEHLASCLIGTNENQTFNIYTGSGANGKSKLTDLMTAGLGDYKATVPITLITQKRNTIGSTSSEIVQLMGVRYAVMQEPTKSDQINEGIMKEITGGDPIQGRALFKDSVTFTPQFKLVVCTNTLFDIASNDDGTWRRIRLCEFDAKFLEKPFEDPKFPREQFPHQFPMDKKITQKFAAWAGPFMSLLVNMAYRLQGNVKDCKLVLARSDKYRAGQDYLTEFAIDKIKIKEGGKIKKSELLEAFKVWYGIHCGRGTVPKGREVQEFMEKRYGPYNNKTGWPNIAIIYNENDDSELIAECNDDE